MTNGSGAPRSDNPWLWVMGVGWTAALGFGWLLYLVGVRPVGVTLVSVGFVLLVAWLVAGAICWQLANHHGRT